MLIEVEAAGGQLGGVHHVAAYPNASMIGHKAIGEIAEGMAIVS